MMGIIQERWGPAWADQPNQKRQIGMQKAPTKAGGSLFSGCNSPFSLNWGSTTLYK